MRIPTQTVPLRDASRCILRTLHGSDAEAVRRHLAAVRRESDFVLETAVDPLPSLSEEAALLRLRARSGNRLTLGAFVQGALVAVATLSPYGELRRVRHRCTVSVSVRRRFWGLGIGSALLAALIDAARRCGYRQMELNVDSRNRRAIRLYERFGFRRCGRVEQALRYAGGSCGAEDTMVLYLAQPGSASPG